jgi:hypothetical protein
MHTSSFLFSYIDPVSGVILLQLIIGGGIGCIARFRHKIWRFGTQLFSKDGGIKELEGATPHLLSLKLQPLGEIEPSAGRMFIEESREQKNFHDCREDREAA